MASFKLVNIEEVSKFVQRCMCCVGTNPEHARQLAELLVAADCRGHFSHGLNRLGNLFIFNIFTLDTRGTFRLPPGSRVPIRQNIINKSRY